MSYFFSINIFKKKFQIESTDVLMEEEPEKEPQHKTQQNQLEGAIEGPEIEIEFQATSSSQTQSQSEVCRKKINLQVNY